MGLTDNCDIFASFHEDGFNKIVSHVRMQRPSLFNYATEAVARNRKLLCMAIKAHPIVFLRGNPLLTIVNPLPVPGTGYGVNFAIQLADVRIDFHPGDGINLPPDLNPPLSEQQFSIQLTLCAGIGCPPKDIVEQFIPTPTTVETDQSDRREYGDSLVDAALVALPTRELICFCLDAYATGGVRIVSYDGIPYLEPFVDGFEIVDIEPKKLESGLECYIGLLLKLVVLPGLRILLRHVPLNLTQGATDLFPQPTNVSLSPMPLSASLPNNPAIEEDQLKAFVKVEVI